MRRQGEANVDRQGAALCGSVAVKLVKTLATTLAAASALSLAMGLFAAPAGADHDDKEHKRQKSKHEVRERFAPAGPEAPAGMAAAYAQECGACHHAYYPGLLPARAWENLMANTSDHFGEKLQLSRQDLTKVRAYLAATAADVAGNKRSRKIMADLGSATPMRITDIGYLRAKHRKLPQEVWARPAVGGFNNCNACHKGASAGDFDDDSAVIPN